MLSPSPAPFAILKLWWFFQVMWEEKASLDIYGPLKGQVSLSLSLSLSLSFFFSFFSWFDGQRDPFLFLSRLYTDR